MFSRLLLSLLIGPGCVFSQPVSAPILQSTTELLEVSVSVHDRKGGPVQGLSKDDFVLLRDGHELPVAVFESPSKNATVPQTSDNNVHYGEIDNRRDPKVSSGIETVLLIDQMDGDGQMFTAERTRSQVLAFISRLHAADHLAIYLLDAKNGLRVVHDFDGSMGDFLAKLKVGMYSSLEQLLPPPSLGRLEGAPTFAERSERLTLPELVGLGRVYGLTDALQAIAEHLNSRSEPKSLIWVAGQFPDLFTRRENTVLEASRKKLLRAFNLLLTTNTAVYPIDARGLMPDSTFDVASRELPIGPGYPLFSPELDPAMEIASHSGGQAYFNSNGIADEIQQAIRDGANRYVLAAYVSDADDGKFHRLELKSKIPGLRLRYKPGYWATPPDLRRTVNSDFYTALNSPFTAEGIHLQASYRRAGDGNSIALSIYIDPAQLQVERQDGQQRAEFDLIIGQKDGVGKVFAIPPYHLSLELATQRWLKTQTKIVVRKQTTSVRLIVRDQQSGRIGSLDIPLNKTS